jgi:hypothetical protein
MPVPGRPKGGIARVAGRLTKTTHSYQPAHCYKLVAWYAHPIEQDIGAAAVGMFLPLSGDCPDFRVNENGTVPLDQKQTLLTQ